MAQRAQVIDITKSYLPGDPNSFVQNLVNTDREDGEEKTLPVVPYEGYNFLPTSYGYRSYFGIDEILAIESLTSRTQFILSYQLPNYKSVLVALCEDGIWLGNANVEDAAWQHVVDISYDPAVLREWTWCIIENILYLYQQGSQTAWRTSTGVSDYGEWGGSILLGGSSFLETVSYASWEAPYFDIGLNVVSHTPNFLVMEAQMGIFKAGLRLGFWDSDNSVAWSSNLDLTDFVPALETLTGATTFGDIVGRIVTIRAHGKGFVVYCTKSVVGVHEDLTGNQLWSPKKILDNIGIYYSRAVTYGQSDNEHIVYSSSGLFMIGKFNVLEGTHAIELLVPGTYDFLKESRDPVYLDTINSRYVFFNILNPDYVYGLTSFSQEVSPPVNTRFLIGGQPWDGEDLPAISLNCRQVATVIKQIVTFGFESTDDTTALWTLITSETQEGTTGPLHRGIGSRNAQTPGFTTADIQDTYASGTTLPAELEVDIFEHVDLTEEYIGNFPPGEVNVTNAMGESVVQVMYKQMADWELFKQHQTEAFVRIGAAVKALPTVPGVSPVAYTSTNVPALPAVPATTVTDTVIGTYKTGNGNIEIQFDIPQNKVVMRKYWQQGKTITRRVTKVWANRAGTPVAGKEWILGSVIFGPMNNPVPNTFTAVNLQAVGLTSGSYTTPGNVQYIVSQLVYDQLPALSSLFGKTDPVKVLPWYQGGNDWIYSYYSAQYGGNLNAWNTSTNLFPAVQDVQITPIYQDYTETVTYIIGAAATASLGSADLTGTQVALAHVTIQVTSDPMDIVMWSPTPIFPTGPSAITFFPPTWTGTETLKIIAASAFPPWHMIDGTFGIELVGDPVAGASATVGEVCETDSPTDYPGTEFGLTYSSFPFLLQAGSPVPLYPIFAGALVLDLHLKKWGKLGYAFSVLLDLEAVNLGNPTIVVADDKGMTACLKYMDDTIRLFDDTPEASLLRYGKIGSYRLGMTTILEARAQFRFPCSGTLEVDSSLDGRTIDTARHYETTWTDAVNVDGLPDLSARWHVVSLSGNYDLTGLETRSVQAGRR